ncbi:MAG: hypothetical protein P8X81_01145 [Woeseiaceae bacterium]|jgi:hypothetical protein
MASKLQLRIFGQVNSPFADRLQTRSKRRGIVLGCIGGAAAIGAGIIAVVEHAAWVLLAAIPFWGFAFLLNMSLRGIFELDDDLLDEHQIAVRNQSYKTAYGYALVFLLIVATAATAFDFERHVALGVAAFAFLTGALAPRLVAAWTLEEPDGRE